MTENDCRIEGCANPIKYQTGRLCNAHYLRWRRHGDPLGGNTMVGAPMAWLKKHSGYKQDDCLEWPFSRAANGYGTIRYDGESAPAHRVMTILVYGNPPYTKAMATHSCGNGHKGCVNPKHLRWSTAKQNQKDRVRHGTSNRPIHCGQSKLSVEDACRIKRKLNNGDRCVDLSKEYGVNYVTIHDIKSGRSWAWLQTSAAHT